MQIIILSTYSGQFSRVTNNYYESSPLILGILGFGCLELYLYGTRELVVSLRPLVCGLRTGVFPAQVLRGVREVRNVGSCVGMSPISVSYHN